MRLIYSSGREFATWVDGVLLGPTTISDRLSETMEMNHRANLTPTGPLAYPDMNTHLGAYTAGIQSGFKVSGDLPEELVIPEGAIS